MNRVMPNRRNTAWTLEDAQNGAHRWVAPSEEKALRRVLYTRNQPVCQRISSFFCWFPPMGGSIHL